MRASLPTPKYEQTLVLDPKTNHDAYSFALKPPMRINDPYPSYLSSEGDPNRSERSDPQPTSGQNFAQIYKKFGTNNDLGYLDTASETRPDPEGVRVPPCKLDQKVGWWVQFHNFLNPDKNDLIPYVPTHDGLNEDDMSRNNLYTPFFFSLIGMFYFLIGSSLTSPALKLITLLISLSHLTTLYLYDFESFSFFYQDMYQSFVAYLGQYV